jgi:hypothetical protein
MRRACKKKQRSGTVTDVREQFANGFGCLVFLEGLNICGAQLFQERKIKPRRADDATRWMMATLSRMFPWRDALWSAKPDALIRWHRKGFRLFWRWKFKPAGRPHLPKDLRRLIREMAAGNVTWGEERIANELKIEARHSGIASHCGKVPGRRWASPHARSEAAVADFRPQPCPR